MAGSFSGESHAIWKNSSSYRSYFIHFCKNTPFQASDITFNVCINNMTYIVVIDKATVLCQAFTSFTVGCIEFNWGSKEYISVEKSFLCV